MSESSGMVKVVIPPVLYPLWARIVSDCLQQGEATSWRYKYIDTGYHRWGERFHRWQTIMHLNEVHHVNILKFTVLEAREQVPLSFLSFSPERRMHNSCFSPLLSSVMILTASGHRTSSVAYHMSGMAGLKYTKGQCYTLCNTSINIWEVEQRERRREEITLSP